MVFSLLLGGGGGEAGMYHLCDRNNIGRLTFLWQIDV